MILVVEVSLLHLFMSWQLMVLVCQGVPGIFVGGLYIRRSCNTTVFSFN